VTVEELHQDCFVVYVRDGSWPAHKPEAVEHPLVMCPTYEEAVRVRQGLKDAGKSCVIRSVGHAGGGD
jgi:hypothetical protein